MQGHLPPVPATPLVHGLGLVFQRLPGGIGGGGALRMYADTWHAGAGFYPAAFVACAHSAAEAAAGQVACTATYLHSVRAHSEANWVVAHWVQTAWPPALACWIPRGAMRELGALRRAADLLAGGDSAQAREILLAHREPSVTHPCVERPLGERWRPVARREVARAIRLGAPVALVHLLDAIYQRTADLAAEPHDLAGLQRRFRDHVTRLIAVGVDGADSARAHMDRPGPMTNRRARALIDPLRPAHSRSTIRNALYAAEITDVVSTQMGGHSRRTRSDVIREARAAVGLSPLADAAPAKPALPAPCT